ncbi:hypothetical protein B0F90DRAFT_726323 [Multifurca ochricompacta]|uniref:Protein kinase domain-containing protein n=1 Tax=Multifurca ochricompacta TaxID=376703 RepID=A0AAD4QRE9_9AGAM|nr:hypothetical protein B0F90DRAFT_726323 [Multifurca ochricompacta]
MAIAIKSKHEVIVKFTRRYFPHFHEFCVRDGLAPELLGYGYGWHVVMIEWIDNEESKIECYLSKYLGKWLKDFRQLVGAFHRKGWVHGDPRDAILIINKKNPKKIMLVDFDWGGDLISGPVWYPTALLHGELVRGVRMIYGSRRTKERDDSFLEFTLGKLQGEEETRMDIS